MGSRIAFRLRTITKAALCILGVFVGYQLLQIVLVLGPITKGISGIPYNQDENIASSEPLIPSLIHQLWKTDNLSSYSIKPSREDWIKKYPNYHVKLWNESTIRTLIKNEYPWIWNTYVSYPYDIQRADAARYIVLHHEGGIYVDLDGFPGEYLLDKIRTHRVVLPATSDSKGPSNHFMMAEKNSPFFSFALSQLEKHNQWIIIPYIYVFWSTGPLFLGDVVRKFLASNPDYEILLLSTEAQYYYCQHKQGRSWHMWDGVIFNFIGDRLQLLVMGSLTIVITFILYLVWRKHNKLYSFLKYFRT